MERTEVLDLPAESPKEPFDPKTYQNATFSMFSGKTSQVKLRLDNALINAVIDRFGKDIAVLPDGDTHFLVTIPVKAEQPLPFFGWLFQFWAQAEIVSPAELRVQYHQTLTEVLQLHQDA
jgi:hypothetical protein